MIKNCFTCESKVANVVISEQVMSSSVLLGDEAQVEARFSPFGDSATPEAR